MAAGSRATGFMSDPIQAYPLQWPPGWKRTASYARKSGRFRRETAVGSNGITRSMRMTVADGVERVLQELIRMGVARDDIVVSSNMPTRLDGLPRSDARNPEDSGVAVYWRALRAGKSQPPKCMAIDRYHSVGDNLAAIAATLEAMRAIDRHGGAEILERAFTGFVALPAPEQWFTILGVSSHASRDEIETAHQRLAARHHPDKGGDHGTMSRINVARDEGLAQCRT